MRAFILVYSENSRTLYVFIFQLRKEMENVLQLRNDSEKEIDFLKSSLVCILNSKFNFAAYFPFSNFTFP